MPITFSAVAKPLDIFKQVNLRSEPVGFVYLVSCMSSLPCPISLPESVIGMPISTCICVHLRSETQAGATHSWRSTPLTVISGNQNWLVT